MESYVSRLSAAMRSEGHSSAYIELCITYARRLTDNNLPVIFDFNHLVQLVGFPASDIIQFMFNKERVYRIIEIPKRTTGTRTLTVPIERLKLLQRWILDNILNRIPMSSHAKGFRKGASIVQNASLHVGKECVIGLDIKDFFPSVKSTVIYKIFRYYGYTKQLASIFTYICTLEKGLPQGAPTSPLLANLACRKLDKRISSLFRDLPVDYSRYADDITISGDLYITGYLVTIRKIIEDEGFTINENKVRIQYSNQRQVVTGLLVNRKLGVPKEMVRQLRSDIYYCRKFGVNSHMRKRGIDKSNYKQHLYGLAYYIKMINRLQGEEFLKQLDTVDWGY